jgi:hypothetical protein
MTRLSIGVTFAAVILTHQASAQSLAQRIAEIREGTAQFSFASRPGVCGDGATYVRDGFGDDSRIYEGGNFSGRSHGDDWPPCNPGPVRVVATIGGGELLRLRTYAGPSRNERLSDRHDLGVVSVGDAVSFLTSLLEHARGRSAGDAVLPIVLADSTTPWPPLLRFARDERLSRSVRSSVDFWLARGAAAALGVVDHGEDPDDDVRSSAVFALSQQQKDVAVPQLIDVVRHNAHPAARAQALFWLGQSGDGRAIDLFDDILRRR